MKDTVIGLLLGGVIVGAMTLATEQGKLRYKLDDQRRKLTDVEDDVKELAGKIKKP